MVYSYFSTLERSVLHSIRILLTNHERDSPGAGGNRLRRAGWREGGREAGTRGKFGHQKTEETLVK